MPRTVSVVDSAYLLLSDKQSGLHSDAELTKKHRKLFKRYPRICEMILRPDLNVNHLHMVLDKWKLVEEGKTDTDAASVEMGQLLFDEFVHLPPVPEETERSSSQS